MCGISIFLSKNNENVVENIISSLYQIQNRGYDSVGIACKNNDWEIYKYASTEKTDSLEILSNSVKNIYSNMAIGHTRWATHGSKTDKNSHPHISMNKTIIVIHNGIISNYQEIKDFLINQKYTFYSETDTEVIANLIEYYSLSKFNNTPVEAIEKAISRLSGTWALGIINTKEANNIYITRHGSPLLLGYNDNIIICSSETSGFIGLIYNYISLDNNDIITINSSGYTSKKYYCEKYIKTITESLTPDPFPNWTIKEITEQPKSILNAINNGGRILNNDIILNGLNRLKDISSFSEVEHVIILGCGTSYYASMLAKYYFNNIKKFNTIQIFDASEFTKIDLPKKGKILSILCSQSGETRDLIKCIDICRENNCILLGVVNVVDSFIAQNVDCGIYMNAGREVAVASTKSFTNTLIILSLIGMWFKEKYNNIPIINSLRKLPTIIENLLANKEFHNKCNTIVEYIDKNQIHSIFILGKGKLYSVAKEGALKIKEITYIHAEGYAAGSLKHGPFALLDKKTISLLLVDEKNKDDLTSTYHEIISRDTSCFVITDTDFNIKTNNIISLPKIEHYQEIIFTVTLQYLAYLISIKRNINPDKPRNLAKVVTVG
tara:strand:- start:435 stop:2261 length:1827 start_codon:yes stop_codon:yes gene_type:complete